MSTPLVALDLGSTKVACAVGIPREYVPGFDLVGQSVVPYASTMDAWLSDPVLVGRAVEQALDQAGVGGRTLRAIVGIKPPQARSERVTATVALGDELVNIRVRDMERLQQRALDHVLGIDRDALLVERLGYTGNGFEGVRDPRGLPATRLGGLFHLVTIPVAARRLIEQVIESAGLELVQLTSTLPAALASSGESGSDEIRRLVVDVGGTATDIGYFAGPRLQALRVISWGGVSLMHTIATERQVTMSQAITWSLEGLACRRPEIPPIIEREWKTVQGILEEALQGVPRPDVILVAGRGALMDGFVEWCERVTGITARLCRSPRLIQLGDLPHQIALTNAMGLLDLATQRTSRIANRSPHLFNRLINRTKSVLAEYF